MTGVIGGMIGGMVTVPSEPTALSATSNVSTQSVLTWTVPARNGGSPIKDYVVQYSTSATFASDVNTFTDGVNASTGATVTGLTNGTTYYFRVAAVNSVGTGLYSGTASATPSTVPGTPTNVQGTANGVTSSTVTWTAPAAANTGPNFTDITGYKVEYALSPYSSYTEFTSDTGNANTSISVTGLTNGGSYRFKVTARNTPNGLGTTSAPSAVVVTNIVPAAPTIGTMTRGTATSTTDTLAWTAPTANGGSAITGYVYQTTTNDGSTFATAVATTNGLTTSQPFNPGYTTTVTKVRVAAVNSLNIPGPYSEISAVGYGGWANPSYVINDDTECPACAACPCPACSCPACAACDCASNTAVAGGSATSTGSKSITGTKGYKSKTCYQWTRDGNTAAGPYDQGGTVACTAAYGACANSTCGCSEGNCLCSTAACTCTCPNTGDTTDYFDHDGYTLIYDGSPGSYFRIFSPNCNCAHPSCYDSQYYTVTICGGVRTITAGSCLGQCANVFSNPC
jgi:hypothetical protein